MATLTIDEKKAKEIYPSSSQELKTILENTFTKEFFSQKITDRVKTFEDACRVLDIDPSSFHIKNLPVDEQAYRQLKIIVKALNEGWTPNWDNSSEYKYYSWFYMQSSGFRLYVAAYFCSDSIVGSRLCFKSAMLAEYAAKQFEDLYKIFFTL